MSNLHIGPWVGEFGNWIFHIVPLIHAHRTAYPDSTIVVSAFEGDDAYLINDQYEYPHDAYMPIKFWPCKRARAMALGGEENYPEHVRKVASYFQTLPGYLNVYNCDNPTFRGLKQKLPQEYYRLRHPNNKDCKILDDTIVIVPRTFDVVFNNNRNWLTERWLELVEKLLDDGLTIYVLGIGQEYLNVIESDRLINYSCLPDGERQIKSIEISEKALASITDNSGGSFVPLYAGCPSIIHSPGHEEPIYAKGHISYRNWFDTKTWFNVASMVELSVERRYEDICIQLDEARKLTQRYEKDKLVLPC